MCATPDTLIDLNALHDDESEYAFRFTDGMLSSMPPSAVRRADVAVSAILRRTGSHHLLNMSVCGEVELQCSRCLQPMTYEMDNTEVMDIRLGDEEDEDEHLLVVDKANPIVDLSWLAYEQIVLSLPIQPVHDEGECKGDVIERLKQMATGHNGTAETTETDPRWQKLKALASGNTETT